MLYTEESTRANIRNRDGKRVFFLGAGDQLTPGARDYLRQERIEILPGTAARIQQYRLQNGAYTDEKPEQMTHLNGNVLVHKSHPRIAFRGAMDTLEAELLLSQLAAPSPFRHRIGEILEFSRKLLSWEVMDEPVQQQTLCSLTEDEQRQRSHRPQEYYGQAHFMPAVTDGEAILRLNRARCASRQAELAAVAAFCDRDGLPLRVDLLRAMNRLSSMIYIIMIQMKAAQAAAKPLDEKDVN